MEKVAVKKRYTDNVIWDFLGGGAFIKTEFPEDTEQSFGIALSIRKDKIYFTDIDNIDKSQDITTHYVALRSTDPDYSEQLVICHKNVFDKIFAELREVKTYSISSNTGDTVIDIAGTQFLYQASTKTLHKICGSEIDRYLIAISPSTASEENDSAPERTMLY